MEVNPSGRDLHEPANGEEKGTILRVFFIADHVVNPDILRPPATAMADAACPPDKDQTILQLQKVDSSRSGLRIFSPVLSPSLDSSTICIPSPYTDLGHDFTSIPFYAPTIISYTGASISDRSGGHRSLSPTLCWPAHGHMGPHVALHQSPARPQHGPPIQSPWMELSPMDSMMTSR